MRLAGLGTRYTNHVYTWPTYVRGHGHARPAPAIQLADVVGASYLVFSCVMVFVILQIRCAARVTKPWHGCVVSNGSSVADVYTDYSSGSLDHDAPAPEEYRNSAIIARVGRNCMDLMQVSASCPVGEAVTALGQYIEFTVSQPHLLLLWLRGRLGGSV